MRTYEVVYILDAAIAPADAEAKLERLHSLATVGGGKVDAVEHWGQRRLAYAINGRETGYYVVAQITAVAEALPEFERLLGLDEEVMRYLLVVHQGERTDGASKLGEVRSDDETRTADGATDAEGDEDGDDAEEEGAEGEGDDEDLDEGDDDDEGADTDADAADETSEEVAVEPQTAPRSGPPEFSGPGARRRRTEGPPILTLDYKDVKHLSYFITDQGKILPKRTTRVSAHFQRQLSRAIKRARYLALIPYTGSFDH